MIPSTGLPPENVLQPGVVHSVTGLASELELSHKPVGAGVDDTVRRASLVRREHSTRARCVGYAIGVADAVDPRDRREARRVHDHDLVPAPCGGIHATTAANASPAAMRATGNPNSAGGQPARDPATRPSTNSMSINSAIGTNADAKGAKIVNADSSVELRESNGQAANGGTRNPQVSRNTKWSTAW